MVLYEVSEHQPGCLPEGEILIYEEWEEAVQELEDIAMKWEDLGWTPVEGDPVDGFIACTVGEFGGQRFAEIVTCTTPS